MVKAVRILRFVRKGMHERFGGAKIFTIFLLLCGDMFLYSFVAN